MKATSKWVQECREKYNAAMRRQANKSRKKAMDFKVKELVRLQEVPTKGVSRKLLRLYNGPYEVLAKEGGNEYTIQKVGEGKRVKVRVHADRLGRYNDLMTVMCESIADCLKDPFIVKEQGIDRDGHEV